MNIRLPLYLAWVFMKVFSRDRQYMLFSLFIPMILITVFNVTESREPPPIDLAIATQSTTQSTTGVANRFMELMLASPALNVTLGDEESLRSELEAGERAMVLVLPPDFNDAASTTELRLLVDSEQAPPLGSTVRSLERGLVFMERELRGTQPMFDLVIEDVGEMGSGPFDYLGFLLPGIIAFYIMQLSIAGSGLNVVEYRRKGILKRLFVTPLRPRDFISAIVLARMTIILIQLTLLMAFAHFMLDISIGGNLAAFYFVIILSTLVFLSLGFCLGSLAKTQQAAMIIGQLFIMPQIFLSEVFFPIDILPGIVQLPAGLLPLSFVATGLRDIATEGASLLAILPSLAGIAAWLLIGFILATRLFVWKEVAA